jgi:hypothetical protein
MLVGASKRKDTAMHSDIQGDTDSEDIGVVEGAAARVRAGKGKAKAAPRRKAAAKKSGGRKKASTSKRGGAKGKRGGKKGGGSKK